jgi:hypothetical protein
VRYGQEYKNTKSENHICNGCGFDSRAAAIREISPFIFWKIGCLLCWIVYCLPTAFIVAVVVTCWPRKADQVRGLGFSLLGGLVLIAATVILFASERSVKADENNRGQKLE